MCFELLYSKRRLWMWTKAGCLTRASEPCSVSDASGADRPCFPQRSPTRSCWVLWTPPTPVFLVTAVFPGFCKLSLCHFIVSPLLMALSFVYRLEIIEIPGTGNCYTQELGCLENHTSGFMRSDLQTPLLCWRGGYPQTEKKWSSMWMFRIFSFTISFIK